MLQLPKQIGHIKIDIPLKIILLMFSFYFLMGIMAFAAESVDPPTDITLNKDNIDEHCPVGTLIGNFSAVDIDGGTYTWTLVAGAGSSGNMSFDIPNGSSSLLSDEIFNYQSQTSYTIRVQVKDENNATFSKSFTININDIDEANLPTVTSLDSEDIDEGNAVGDVVGILTTTGVHAGTNHIFTFETGAGDDDNDSFTIDGDELKAAEVFDEGVKDSYDIRIRSTSQEGDIDIETFTIAINFVNSEPTDITLTDNSFEENRSVGYRVGFLNTTDADDGESFTYSFVEGTGDDDNDKFDIRFSNFELATEFDFETQSTHTVRIRTEDSNGGSFEKALTIFVEDSPFEPITDIFLSQDNIDEENTIGDAIGTLTSEDDDAGDVHTYTIRTIDGSTDHTSFSIDGDVLESAIEFDFETETSYTIRIRSSDGTGFFLDKDFTITINNVTEAPTEISLSVNTIDENNEVNDVIGTLASTDGDEGETHIYSLVTNPGNSFNINNNELRASESFDFESTDSYDIRIESDDQNGGVFEKDFTITVNDINDVPSNITLSNTSIDENNAIGDLVGLLSTSDDDAGDTHTYTFESNPGTAFTINGDRLEANAVFDFDTQSSYPITVRSTDFDGDHFDKNYTITIIEDTQDPERVSFTPTSNSVDVPMDGDLVVAFDEPIVAGAGAVTVKRLSNGVLALSGNAIDDSDIFEIDGNTLIIKMENANNAGFESLTAYYVTISNDAVRDVVGNSFSDGFSASTIWRFTTDREKAIWKDGVWSNGDGPGILRNTIIDEDYSTDLNGSISTHNLTVNSGAVLTIDGEERVFVNNDLVNNGSIIVESGATLYTFGAKSVSGNNIEIRRNTRYANGKYSFVGSTVQQDASVVGSDLGSHVYKYDETIDYDVDGIDRWINASSDELIPGKGYTQADQKEIVFIGVPNDGTIVYSGTYTEDTDDANEGWNLVANPYPAAIKVSDFLTENDHTSGSVYIWDDNGSNSQRGTNSDYIVANATMFSTTSAGGQTRYNYHLGSAQGFFVKLNSAADTDITFTESMRRNEVNDDDNFFRETELPIIRVNLTNSEGLFKQAVIGLAEDATEHELNKMYDAQAFNASAENGLFTIKAGRALTLNGIPSNWESIQLQFNSAKAYAYSIDVELEGYDGALFLKDNLTNEIIDLRNGSYSFTSVAGIDTDRFELMSNPFEVLGMEKSDVFLYTSKKMLYVQQKNNESRSYQLFNMQGRKLMTMDVSGTKEINLQTLSSGIYLIFDGRKTHKIILK